MTSYLMESRQVWQNVTKGAGQGVNFSSKLRDVIYGRPLLVNSQLHLGLSGVLSDRPEHN